VVKSGLRRAQGIAEAGNLKFYSGLLDQVETGDLPVRIINLDALL